MPEPFILKFKREIEKEGYQTITAFVNDWIGGGGTFHGIYEWCLLRNIEVKYLALWMSLRRFLTIPYSYDDQFWYKWTAVAKAKGFDNTDQMVRNYLRNFTTTEICKELDVSTKYVWDLIGRLRDKRHTPIPNKKRGNRPHKDKEGFVRGPTKIKWKGMIQQIGFRTLKETVIRLREKELTYRQIAEKLGTNPSTLCLRLKQANINPKSIKRVKKTIR